ncbi:cereblon family protein [Salidesulfovibrio onnuriiensis]|uniref:cereblon family protein n=1 Tax=Salidesulfovibrio onnuriiensis TaxID=2583823 RepID=UPI0011C7AFFC|nr:cereblon family protein [Salidesulfovibrio onnuriiensis]
MPTSQTVETHYLLKGAPEPNRDSPRPEEGLDDGQGGRRVFICRSCGNRITSAAAAMAVNGKHKHTFFNPHGYVFELGCFSSAPGTIRVGPASPEFTWFSGHTWQTLVCGRCNIHIGWHYQADSGSGFYGLILPQVAEVDEDGA